MHMTGAVLLLMLIGTVATLKSVAGSHLRPAYQIGAGSGARSLLQTDPSRSPARSPEGPPLPTPADALNVCSTEVLRQATKCKDRKRVWFEEGGAEAGERSVAGLCTHMHVHFTLQASARDCVCLFVCVA